MTFAARSSADSSAPRSLWWRFTSPETGTKFLVQSTWPTIVRRFQQSAKAILSAGKFGLFAFDGTGACFSGNAIDQLPAVLRANVRRVDAITADGIFGPETRDTLGYLLCATGQRAQATLLATNPAVLPAELVRQVIWFAQYFAPSDLFNPSGEPRSAIPEKVIKLGGGIALPSDIELPRVAFRLVEPLAAQPESNRDWIGLSIWGNPFPRAPSEGGGLDPWPALVGDELTPQAAGKGLLPFVIGGAFYAIWKMRKRRG